LDASVKDTSVCIVDEMGKIVWEVKVTSEPDALLATAPTQALLDHSRGCDMLVH
jgi:transposase